MLEARIGVLQKENERLGEENVKFRKLIVSQQTEIQNLNSRSESLDAELQQSQSQSRMLRVQLDESKEDLGKVRGLLNEKDAHMEQLKNQLGDILKQMQQKDLQSEKRELELKDILQEMKRRLAELTAQLEGTRGANLQLRQQVEDQEKEIERLRAKLSSDSRFKKFVNIKREVNDLREQNQSLYQRVTDHEKCSHHIPVMKRSGRVTSAGSNVVPPTATLVQQIAPTPSATGLKRPKSCRTLRSLDLTEDDLEFES